MAMQFRHIAYMVLVHQVQGGSRTAILFQPRGANLPRVRGIDKKKYARPIGRPDHRVTSPLECWPSRSTH